MGTYLRNHSDDEFSVAGEKPEVEFMDFQSDCTLQDYDLEDGPVVVTVPFPFVDGKPKSVLVGETSADTISIENTSTEPVTLWSVRIFSSNPEDSYVLSMMRSPLNDADEEAKQSFLGLTSVEDRTLWLSCIPKDIGLHTSIVHVDIGDEKIECVAFLLADDDVSKALFSDKPYSRRRGQNKKFEHAPIVPGCRPTRQHTQGFKYKLPQFAIPADIRELIESKQRPDVLSEELTTINYAQFFSTLLVMEELNLEEEMRSYDMEGVSMRRRGMAFLSLEVPGLAERRPSLVQGDYIVARYAGRDVRPYQGFIHKVEADEIFLQFDKQFHLNHHDRTDSQYILCGLYKRPMVQAWSLSQPDWTCKIDEGLAGIAYARWSPDSRHILTTSEFQLRLTVWSLVNTACVHVQWPKHASRGVSFTKDGKFAAICIRRDCKDYINLLSCQSWEIMGVFAVDTVDLAGVEWSPDDSAIVVWDSLLEYKVLIYSPDGRCLFKYLAYESGLGVKTVAWSPCGQFLAVGSYDQAVRILNHLTWKTFAEFTHAASIRSPCNAVIFKEVDDPWQLDMSDLCLSEGFSCNMQGNGAENGTEGGGSRVKYDVMDVPITLPSQKPATDKPNPKQGIGMLSWSSDSQYFFTRNDNMPTALWIWDICRLELAAVLVQKDPIRAAAWDPTCPRLVLCTESPHLYMWTPSGACCVNIPLPNFRIVDLKWNSDGSCLLLKDREAFCCAAIVSSLPEEEPDQSDDSSEDE